MCILSEYLLCMLDERFYKCFKLYTSFISTNMLGMTCVDEWCEYTLAAIDLVPTGQTPVAMDILPVRRW